MKRPRISVHRGPSYLTTGARQPWNPGSKSDNRRHFSTRRVITRAFCGTFGNTTEDSGERTGGSNEGCCAQSDKNIFNARIASISHMGACTVIRSRCSKGRGVSSSGVSAKCCCMSVAVSLSSTIHGMSMFGHPVAPLCRLIPVFE